MENTYLDSHGSASLSEDWLLLQVTGSLFPGEISVAAVGVGAIVLCPSNWTGTDREFESCQQRM